ncbi:MAG: mannosyltransferase [Pseudonocardia sp. SCN 72-86]|nr:MAG: mannosyltransferase [Pseudonocardia sp. SCN 72-86]
MSAVANEAKIRVQGVGKKFTTRSGETIALDDVSLHIAEGQFCSIVGPSGCGKTTLLRMLADLERPTTGSAAIGDPRPGKPIQSLVFQGDSVFPWMTVWDNAAYGLRMRGAPESEIREVVGHYLGKTSLSKFAKAYPHELSGGMRQRVSVARAFANDPDVLLMDEPFSALDEQNKAILQDELLRIWEETRKTVLFITHSVDEAVTLSDRVVVMTARPGRVKVDIDIPLPRPRNRLQLRANPEYGELVYRIWSALQDEVLQTAGLQPEENR